MKHVRDIQAGETQLSFSAQLRRETVDVVAGQLGRDDEALFAFFVAAAGQELDGRVMLETSSPELQTLYASLLGSMSLPFRRRNLKRRFTVTFLPPAEPSAWHRLTQARDLEGTTLCFAALFAATGSLADPERASDLEFRVRDSLLAARIVALAADIGVALSVLPLTRGVRLYTKNREAIAEMILHAGAQRAYLVYESEIVERELTNTVNRQVNCDQGNAKRLADSSAAQLEAIRRLEETRGLDSLPEQLKDAALARLAHPELTIGELGALMQPPIGKSGMSHRLKKLLTLSQETPKTKN